MLDRSSTPRSATAAIVGGLLVAASVAAELIYPVQASDGTSREPLVHAVYLVAWIVGWGLVALAALDLRAAVGASGKRATIGAWLVVAGAAALAISGIGLLIGVLAGVYLEALFLLFVLGLPLLAIGCLLLGLSMRREGGAAWILWLVAAAGFLLAFLADMDPIHDIGLVGGALAIAAAGWALRVGRADVRTAGA